MIRLKTQIETDSFIDALEQALPPVFARHRLTKLSGGLINSRTIANKMSQGIGPKGIKIGRNVGFSRDGFISWLKSGHLKTLE